MREIIRTMMRPMVKLLLRHGVAFAEFSNITRQLYVDVADSEFRIEGRKQTVSRIAVLTGISRREVKKILDDQTGINDTPVQYNRAARVFFGWLHDDEFCGPNGQPLALKTGETGAGTFDNLVKKYSGDMPARAVLDEVMRVGAVTKDGDLLTLNSTGYVPTRSDELLETSSVAVADLLSTIDYNDKSANPQDTRLQLTVNYDNVTREGAEVFRILSREKSKEILLYLDRFLAKQDRDASPEVKGEGTIRTGLSIFYFEESSDDIDESSKGDLDET